MNVLNFIAVCVSVQYFKKINDERIHHFTYSSEFTSNRHG